MDSQHTVAGEQVPAQATANVVTEQEPEIQAVDQGAAEMGDLRVEDWDYQRPRRGEVRDGVILSISNQEVIIDVGAKRDGIVPYTDLQRLGPEGLAELSVGDEVPVYVLRPEDQDGNLLVSLFLARQTHSWKRAQELADSGEVWEAEVVGYNKGGIVVPVGELRGFIPASQIPGFPAGMEQEDRLERLAQLVGETVHVKVIEINRRKRRLILSAQAAHKQWRKRQRERVLEDLREGEVRKGVVTSLATFGAFVDLGGVDGLVHLSELSWRRVRHPKEVVKVGQEVEVYVLRLDEERDRIGLSLKRLEPEPWALVEDRYELGQLVEGVVSNVVDFGAFAEIDEGIEGLIHVSELADMPISHPKEVVKKGDLLLLRIIRIDARRKRLGLSLKRVLESEWAEWAAHTASRERVAEAEAVSEPQTTENVDKVPVAAVQEQEESAETPVAAVQEQEESAETPVAAVQEQEESDETPSADLQEQEESDETPSADLQEQKESDASGDSEQVAAEPTAQEPELAVA